jgi:ankyrin repeat protein
MNIQDSTSSSSTALIHATRGSSWNMDVYGHGLSHYQFLLAGDVPKNPGVEVIEYLLKHEANACDKEADSEKSVLMMAVSNGDKAIVPALLTSGAAVDIQTRPLKESAITLAVDNAKAEICKILLQHGVDLSLTDSTGRTIAHHIARAANFEILSYFLPYDEIDWKRSEGAEFHDFEKDCAGQYGLTPLHLAAKYNFVGFIQKLYDVTILEDLDPQCGGNLRPLHWAAVRGNSVVIEALLARGADVNAITTVKGRTALHWAANQGHSQAVLALIRGGANVELLDKDGCSAAAHTSNPAILHELKAASMSRGKSCTQPGGKEKCHFSSCHRLSHSQFACLSSGGSIGEQYTCRPAHPSN